MEFIELEAKVRTTTGNGPARALRREGRTPAVLYGRKAEPLKLSVDTADMETLLKQGASGSSVIKLAIKDGDTVTKQAMIKELQSHPVSQSLIHIDFYEVDMDRKVTIMVPVVTTGQSAGVELGGVLQIIRRELEITCLPTQIPEAIEVDVTDLQIGDSLHINQVSLPEGVEIDTEIDFTVLTVTTARVEEVEEEIEDEEGEELEGEEETEEEAEPEA